MQVLTMNETQQVNGGMKNAADYAKIAVVAGLSIATIGAISYGMSTVVAFAVVEEAVGKGVALWGYKTTCVVGGAIFGDFYADLGDMALDYIYS